MEHARYGGSTYSRTLNCPPWAKFCDTVPELPSSPDADRGTMLHQAMDTIYTEDADFESRSVIGLEYMGLTITEELYEDKIVRAIAAVEEIFEHYNVAEDGFLCESRVVISKLSWGTSDLLATGEVEDGPYAELAEKLGRPVRVGICLDYKFGDGIPVHAVDNDQGRFYSSAAAVSEATKRFFKDIDLLAIGIIQPNDRGSDDFTLWEVPAEVLQETFQEALAAEATAERSNPKDPHQFSIGDHCRFCAGRGLCPPTSGQVAAMRRLDVTAPDLLKNLPSHAELEHAEGTINAIRALIHSQIEEGVDVEGFRIVAKRAKRSYTSEARVIEIAKLSRKLTYDDVTKKTFKSPTQLEKVCKSKGLDFDDMFGAYVQKVSSGTTLVAADDNRPSAGSINALRAALTRD